MNIFILILLFFFSVSNELNFLYHFCTMSKDFLYHSFLNSDYYPKFFLADGYIQELNIFSVLVPTMNAILIGLQKVIIRPFHKV